MSTVTPSIGEIMAGEVTFMVDPSLAVAAALPTLAADGEVGLWGEEEQPDRTAASTKLKPAG